MESGRKAILIFLQEKKTGKTRPKRGGKTALAKI